MRGAEGAGCPRREARSLPLREGAGHVRSLVRSDQVGGCNDRGQKLTGLMCTVRHLKPS